MEVKGQPCTVHGPPPGLESWDGMGTLPGAVDTARLLCPLSNIVKAAAREGGEGSDLGKPRKNFSSGSQSARGTTGLLRRKEVTEEEAER